MHATTTNAAALGCDDANVLSCSISLLTSDSHETEAQMAALTHRYACKRDGVSSQCQTHRRSFLCHRQARSHILLQDARAARPTAVCRAVRASFTRCSPQRGLLADCLPSHGHRAICPIPRSRSTSSGLARPVHSATALCMEAPDAPVATASALRSSFSHDVRPSSSRSPPGLSGCSANSSESSEDDNSPTSSSKSSSLARRWLGPYAIDAKGLAHLLVTSPSRIELAHIGDYQEQQHLAEARDFYRLKKASRRQRAGPEGDKLFRARPQRGLQPVKRLLSRAASDLASWRQARSRESGDVLHGQEREQEILHVRLRGDKEERLDLDL